MKVASHCFTPRLIAGISVGFFGMIILWVIPLMLPPAERWFWDLPREVYFYMMRPLAFLAGIVAGGRNWAAPFFVALSVTLAQGLYLLVTGWGQPLLLARVINTQMGSLLDLVIAAALGMGLAFIAEWIARRFAPRVANP